MLASNFSTERAVSVSSQAESGAAASSDAEIVNVHIVAPNRYLIAGDAYDSATLLLYLQTQQRDFSAVAVSIGPGPGVAVQTMMDLISLVKRSGIDNVSMSRRSLP